MRESKPRTFATTLAMSPASPVLSPSRTNCTRAAVGVDHDWGKEASRRRVRPPPGMNGTALSAGLVSKGRCSDTGDEYGGMGSWERDESGVEAQDGVFGGWI
jgi:hypothetical protein